MICINPDVMEIIPDSCTNCGLAFYDASNGGHFCGISRFDVSSHKKNRTKHHGCQIFDPDVHEEEPVEELEDNENEETEEDYDDKYEPEDLGEIEYELREEDSADEE